MISSMAASEVVPEGQRSAFAAAPIPFSDAVLLVPVQVGMLASMSAVFGLPVSTGFLSTLLGSALTALGATFAGRGLQARDHRQESWGAAPSTGSAWTAGRRCSPPGGWRG